MKGRFTEAELTEAGSGLMARMLKESVIEPAELPVLLTQIGFCIQQIINQPDYVWEAVPDYATADQLILLVYLLNTDEALGTNYVDQLFNRIESEQGEAFPSLNDLTGFQA